MSYAAVPQWCGLSLTALLTVCVLLGRPRGARSAVCVSMYSRAAVAAALLVALPAVVRAEDEEKGFLDESSGRYALAMLVMIGIALLLVVAYCIWYSRRGPSAQIPPPMYGGQPGMMMPADMMVQPHMMQQPMPQPAPTGPAMMGVSGGMPAPAAQAPMRGPGPLNLEAGMSMQTVQMQPSTRTGFGALPPTTPKGHSISHAATATPDEASAYSDSNAPSRRPLPRVQSSHRNSPSLTKQPSSPGLHRIMSRKITLTPLAGQGGHIAAASPVTPRRIRDYRQEAETASLNLSDDDEDDAPVAVVRCPPPHWCDRVAPN